MVSPDRDRAGGPSGLDGPEAPSEPGPAHASPSETAPPRSDQPESAPLHGGPPEAAPPGSGRPESGPLRLHTDTGVCAGAGQCVRAAPDLFDQGDDGLVVLLRADVPERDRERALTAADWCPSGAVSVHEAS